MADTTKFYKLLGVSKQASTAEIKTAYRKLSLKHHPDKGGNESTFIDMRRAYEVLSDKDKRARYDRDGEEGLDERDGGDPSDPFRFFERRRPQRKKTKSVVTPLKVSLEQLYCGASKNMAITREVIDETRGVRECRECDGRGVTIQVVRRGPIIQQMQSQCRACGGQGKSFQTSKQREILEVGIQKGAPSDHKIVFREKADEHPDADTGDVVFVLKEQEHAEFKRKGADLFVERKISLVEALCGFQMELTHLDGRKLLIKTSPGEIVKPMAKGFDPLADADSPQTEWEEFNGFDCPGIENIAEGATTHIDTLKKACDTQLKRQGVDVGAFVVDSRKAYFKQCTREEVLSSMKPAKGKTLYVLADPNRNREARILKAVKGEGMPTFKNPFMTGNLFLILTIDFPESLTAESQAALSKLLPPPLSTPRVKEDDADVEVHSLTDIDPVQSHNSNKVNMAAAGDSAYDEDDDEGGSGGMQGPGSAQCQQQ